MFLHISYFQENILVFKTSTNYLTFIPLLYNNSNLKLSLKLQISKNMKLYEITNYNLSSDSTKWIITISKSLLTFKQLSIFSNDCQRFKDSEALWHLRRTLIRLNVNLFSVKGISET